MRELDEAIIDLRRILEPIPTGTRERPRHKPRIDLTIQRIRAWHLEPAINLATSTRRGGTRAITETEDAIDDYTLSRRAEYDAATLARLLAGVAAICARYTIPISTEGLKLNPPPGCRSCARSRKVGDVTLPGFWNPIAERYRGRKLCNWCGEYYAGTHQLPPLEAVEIYHRQTPAAAGRWLAKHGKRPTRRRR